MPHSFHPPVYFDFDAKIMPVLYQTLKPCFFAPNSRVRPLQHRDYTIFASGQTYARMNRARAPIQSKLYIFNPFPTRRETANLNQTVALVKLEQRRLGAPCARNSNYGQLRESATAPASSSRRLPPPPRRPDPLKAKPSPPLTLSTLTAALFDNVDAVNPIHFRIEYAPSFNFQSFWNFADLSRIPMFMANEYWRWPPVEAPLIIVQFSALDHFCIWFNPLLSPFKTPELPVRTDQDLYYRAK
ncbi:hypothetical protein R3P38DRAFT_3558452 [Favolaschia claudopus]|uniref:Uncharacterized protein n=1 Tax=Favolaschia claudopus TaxID=2862362 RepID=A0AAW0AZI0_9AGAR